VSRHRSGKRYGLSIGSGSTRKPVIKGQRSYQLFFSCTYLLPVRGDTAEQGKGLMFLSARYTPDFHTLLREGPGMKTTLSVAFG